MHEQTPLLVSAQIVVNRAVWAANDWRNHYKTSPDEYLIICCENGIRDLTNALEKIKAKKSENMKVTIELSKAEVAGIKAYLKSLDYTRPTNADVIQHIDGIVKATLYSPAEAVCDYINTENKAKLHE